MNSAKKVFLLPCAGCACEIDVVSGQAGGRVECPSCGRHNEVPKFRDLNELQLKSQPAAGRSARWGLPHAVALAGLVCAALAWGTAAVVGSTPKAAFDVSLLRASVEAADDAVLYRSLNAFAQSTVDRLPMRGEVDVQRRALFAQGMSSALYAIGGLGALAAAVAGGLVLASGKRS